MFHWLLCLHLSLCLLIINLNKNYVVGENILQPLPCKTRSCYYIFRYKKVLKIQINFMYILLVWYMRTLCVCERERERERAGDNFFPTSGQINTFCIINPHLLPYLILLSFIYFNYFHLSFYCEVCFCEDVIKNTLAVWSLYYLYLYFVLPSNKEIHRNANITHYITACILELYTATTLDLICTDNLISYW